LAIVAGGLLLYSTADAETGFALIGGSQMILGLGIGLAMAPATDSIMGAVPAARASVGSAMNDTVRLVGGSLGVAVLGSLLASNYRDGMSGATQGLPTDAAAAAGESITNASAVADRIGGTAGRLLHEAAGLSFVDAMQSAMLVAAAVTLAGAVVALVLLPARAGDESSASIAAVPEPAVA
jgi:hypothetical protein